MHELKLDFDGRRALEKYETDKWSHYCEPLGAILDHVNGYFPTTTFGAVLGSSLALVAEAVTEMKFSSSASLALLALVGLLGCSFTTSCYKSMAKLASGQSDPKVQAHVSKFFKLAFPFDNAVEVAKTALDCLPEDEWPTLVEYFRCAADIDRVVLVRWNPSEVEIYRTFLAFKSQPEREKYIQKCMRVLPFADWVITDDDLDFVSSLSGITLADEEALDEMHARVVKLYPAVFTVDRAATELSGDFLSYSLADATHVGFEFSNELDGDPSTNDSQNAELQVPPSPYLFRPPSRPDLFAFLWYSLHNTLDDQSWAAIEQYALSIPDAKFHVAFLGYGLRHLLAIDTEAWAKRIVVDRSDRNTYYSFSFFCTFVH